MRPTLHAFVSAVLICVFAASAEALFSPVSDARNISSDYTSFCPGCGPEGEDVIFTDPRSDGPGTPFAPFDSSVLSGSSWFASQNSSVSTTALSGTGSAGTSTGEEGGASSIYDITFDVDAPTAVSLEGMLTGASFGGFLHFTLFEGSNALYEQDASGVFGSVPLDFGGVLAAGQYRVLVEASFSGGEIGDQLDYDFTLQVPEPGGLGTFGLGLAGLAVARRRPLRGDAHS